VKDDPRLVTEGEAEEEEVNNDFICYFTVFEQMWKDVLNCVCRRIRSPAARLGQYLLNVCQCACRHTSPYVSKGLRCLMQLYSVRRLERKHLEEALKQHTSALKIKVGGFPFVSAAFA